MTRFHRIFWATCLARPMLFVSPLQAQVETKSPDTYTGTFEKMPDFATRNLHEGRYALYFENYSGQKLEAGYVGPDSQVRALAADQIFHE